MKHGTIRLSPVGVLCVVLVATYAPAQENLWEAYKEAADESYQQGNYAEAEKQWLAALQEAENFGPEDPRLATSLNNLAVLYRAQAKYAEAEPLYQRALAIQEKVLGPEHPDVANSLNNLAFLYGAQGKYAEAEPLYQRSLAIWEKALGPEHPQGGYLDQSPQLNFFWGISGYAGTDATC